MIHLMSSPFSSMNHYPYHYYTNSFYPHQNPMQSPTQHLQHPLLLPHTHSPNSKLHYADSTQPSMENLYHRVSTLNPQHQLCPREPPPSQLQQPNGVQPPPQIPPVLLPPPSPNQPPLTPQ